MAVYLSAALRQKLLDADDHRCAYCGTPQANSGSPMVVDHIVPRSQGGATRLDNLCFACYRCNLYKGPRMEAIDPLSGAARSPPTSREPETGPADYQAPPPPPPLNPPPPPPLNPPPPLEEDCGAT